MKNANKAAHHVPADEPAVEVQPPPKAETTPAPVFDAVAERARYTLIRELQRSAQQFQLEVAGIDAYLEFADQHGDEHLVAVHDMARPLLRRCGNYAQLFEELANDLEGLH